MSGEIRLLDVYMGHMIVGHGFMFNTADMLYKPELSTFDGEPLPEGIFNLVITDVRVVLISETKH